jgi:hypothetical protein
VFAGFNSELLRFGQQLLSFSVASLMTLITILIYLVLVPILVFFLLKDKELLIGWMAGFLPKDRPSLMKSGSRSTGRSAITCRASSSRSSSSGSWPGSPSGFSGCSTRCCSQP